MKKITIIISSLSNGGAERIVSLISNNIDQNYKIYLILFKDDITYPYSGEIVFIDRDLYKKNFLSRKFIITRNLKNILKEINPDITLSFLTYPNINNVLVGKGKRILSVRSMKSKGLTGIKGGFYKFLIKRLYNKGDKLVAISEGVKQDLISNFNIEKRKIEVIHNFCDIKYINDKKTEKLTNKEYEIFNNPTIITAGRLDYPKGQWHLIRSFKKVKNEIKNAQLIILGKGHLENYLTGLARELSLEKSIHFIGFKENPFKYFYNSDLFVFSSLYEGFGNVILEAMASDLPIISSDCLSGPREILSNDSNYKLDKKEYAEYGLLLPVCDGIKYNYKDKLTEEEVIMADSIIEMIKNDELRNKYIKKSQSRIHDFSVNKKINEWLNLLNELN
jgi:N-acetylgalactosamine-N,N'-diacetylbacillosaminyl-diphospho-undecaprenol 4-alpha-N-acetylgalactosaminyltransferase